MDEELKQETQDAPAKKLETPEEIRQKYEQSCRTAEQYKVEILNGLKAGEPLDGLFLKATKIVSLLTENPNFTQLCEKHMRHD